jgi:hypothetical protein
MTIANQKFNLTDQTELFKINYYKKSENMYNSDNVLEGTIKKRYDFTGKSRFVATPLSFSGGVGSGSLPKANAGTYGDALITSKRVYARAQIEREAIKAAANDKGAFVRATAETVKKSVESYMRNSSRILFGDGSGLLGLGDGATNVTGAGSVADPYIFTISAASFKEANLEERDFVNYDTETSLLEIVAVDVAARQVSLVGSSAGLAALVAGPASTALGLYMQGSRDNDPQGLKGILDASIAGSGSLYNIPVQRRWSMTFSDAGGAGITTDAMNGLMLEVERKQGKVPNCIVTSFAQFQNILALMEDHKRYPVEPRSKDLKGKLSFNGVEFMSTRGPVAIFADRFCEDDRIYFLNKDYIERHHRPDFGWFDDDGTVFLRVQDSDDYEARYGGYYENFITPSAHGCIYGLAV